MHKKLKVSQTGLLYSVHGCFYVCRGGRGGVGEDTENELNIYFE